MIIIMLAKDYILDWKSLQIELNAKNLVPTFLSIFFWVKIDYFKNQYNLIFMAVQKTTVAEKCKIVTFGHYIFPESVQTTLYMLSV